MTRRDLQTEAAPVGLQRDLMVARMKQILAHSRAPRISASEILQDWQLLEKVEDAGHEILSRNWDQEN